MMKKVFLAVFAAFALSVSAKISLPEIIGDNMVLQQQTETNIWGTAEPRATIQVTTDWSAERFTAVADNNGNWQVIVRTPQGSKQEHLLTISEIQKPDEGPSDQLTLSKVLIGEVWFASGQSNMEMPLEGFWNCPVNDNNEVIATAADNPWIRIAPIRQNGKTEPVESAPGKWEVPSPATAPGMSATSFFFAQLLQKALDVPVGVIACAWGGSRVEGWLPREVVETYNDVDIEKEWKEGWMGTWWHYYTPVVMYNGMLHPLRHYTIRGFLWYQGESNVGKDDTYPTRLKTMVDIWRQEFGGTEESLPFYLVEIAPWAGYGEWLSAPLFRECQHRAAELIGNSGCISTNDLVEPFERDQIHPAEKRQVGYRLAYMALNRTYGFKSIACDSPEFDHMEVHDGELELFFRYAEQGLSPLQDIEGFEIAGDDGRFFPAEASVNTDHRSVVVKSTSVPAPKNARYCFKAFQIGNLKSVRNLPVVPFRTDRPE